MASSDHMASPQCDWVMRKSLFLVNHRSREEPLCVGLPATLTTTVMVSETETERWGFADDRTGRQEHVNGEQSVFVTVSERQIPIKRCEIRHRRRVSPQHKSW